MQIKYLQFKEKYIREKGREPTIDIIAKELEVEREDIAYSFDAVQDPVSLQEPVYNDGAESIYIMDQVKDSKNTDEAMEYEVYVEERRSGKLQMARMQWYADYNDPTSWLKMYQTGNAQNDVNWSNADYDKLIEESDKNLDEASRQEQLLAAEKILVSDDTVICPLFSASNQDLIDPSLTGYYNDGLAYTFWYNAHIKEDTK